MLNFCHIVVAILKMVTSRNCSMSESIRDIIIYPHIKLWWYWTMLFAILWLPFWKGRPVEIFQCEESIRDIIIYPHMKWRWNRTMMNLCGIVVAILKMATGRNFSIRQSIQDINVGKIRIFAVHHFDLEIVHISNCWWYRTMLNFCDIVTAILKMATARNFSISGINSGHYYLPTYQIVMISAMLNFCDIVAVILKMVTSRNCSMSGLNSGHHYLPTYQIVMISDNVEFLRYCGGHFKNGNQKKFFNVGTQFLTSLSTHISNCDDIGQCWIFAILWWPFRK